MLVCSRLRESNQDASAGVGRKGRIGSGAGTGPTARSPRADSGFCRDELRAGERRGGHGGWLRTAAVKRPPTAAEAAAQAETVRPTTTTSRIDATGAKRRGPSESEQAKPRGDVAERRAEAPELTKTLRAQRERTDQEQQLDLCRPTSTASAIQSDPADFLNRDAAQAARVENEEARRRSTIRRLLKSGAADGGGRRSSPSARTVRASTQSPETEPPGEPSRTSNHEADSPAAPCGDRQNRFEPSSHPPKRSRPHRGPQTPCCNDNAPTTQPPPVSPCGRSHWKTERAGRFRGEPTGWASFSVGGTLLRQVSRRSQKGRPQCPRRVRGLGAAISKEGRSHHIGIEVVLALSVW